MLKVVSFAELQTGEQVQVSPGDVLVVVVSFKYNIPTARTVELWLSLVVPPGRDYTFKERVDLQATDGVKDWTGSIEMPIQATGILGTLVNRTYDLWFEIPYETSEVAIAYSAVVVTGIVTGITNIIEQMMPMIMMVMMLGLVMPMMAEG